MNKRLCAWLLAILLVGAVSSAVVAAAADAILADELALRAAGLTTDGPSLLEFFRRRAQVDVEPGRLDALVRQLSDSAPEAREKAVSEIVRIGPAAIARLREVVKDPDAVAAAGSARRCLEILDSPDAAKIPCAAARLLAVRQPDGLIPVLLAYLPFADDEAVIEDIKTALNAVAYRDGRPDAALLRALEDPVSIRRAVAIDVLCHAGIAEPRPTLRKLLKDEKPIVRLRAALALANVKEAEAVGTLIDLLRELPVTYGKQAEEFLLNLAGDQAPKAVLSNDASRRKCADAWAAWWKKTEGPALLDDVRKRTIRDADRGKVQALIRQLGDDAFEGREKAQYELLQLGPAVVGDLKQAMTNPDVEISTRAAHLIAQIEKNKIAAISQVTLRLIGFRKPAGSAEALLGFLPFAEDEGTAEEVQDALDAVAVQDGHPDPVLVKALHDKNPLWRAAAAAALCQPGFPDLQMEVRKLLQDPVAMVRMKAALALAGLRDREAVPVLIASIGDLSPEQSSPAEEFLTHLAGDKAPSGMSGNDDGARKKRRDAWAAWWKDSGPRIQLALVSRNGSRQYYFGYTLIALPGNGQVMELGTENKVRWQLKDLQNPMDVQVLPGNRVLVTEYSASQVTERNLKNEVLWRKSVSYPISAERLANGHTFIVTRNLLLEVDRSGKEVLTLQRPNHDVMAARKLRDGQIVLVSSQGYCARLDNGGKESKKFNIQNMGGTNYIDITAKGHVIIPQQWNNKVFEYDADGKLVWEATVHQPMAASRLPNGNTLVSSQMWPCKVFELDKTGKVVWEYQTENYAGRVKRH
jgi:HEAT repeat protein